ncbi:MAG TPA: hypothetical protein VMM18_00730 [Gemmatimonadaceae bacterium]|nr:hypothetical protein [Gemmatimonadaceae bacterium]
MNPRGEIRILRSMFLATCTATLLVTVGCNLDIENPNDPDAGRAFVDPAGLQQLLGGAFRTWVETRGDYWGAMPMTAMADNYTASWNNAAIRFYSSVGAECPARCGWSNSATAPEAAGGPSVESQWYGYYTILSSANDVLLAVSQGLCFDSNCDSDNTLTSRNTAIAKMMQGMAFAGIALIYDQGFVADETTDVSAPTALPFATREEVRNAALTKFEEAWQEAGTKTWSTPSEWMGVGSGTSYSRAQIQQIIRTMQAELIALYPRNATENAQADWVQVADHASQGISSGTQFDWEFYIDVSGRQCGLDCVKTWGNSIGTMRVDTRVAAILTDNHVHPWPEAQGGNPCPTVSADRRVGDGSWGPEDDFNGYATEAATANAGSDFACSGVAIFPPARGQYHQSNLAHIRYNHLAYIGENLPGSDATGQDPYYTRQMNDLLWAEGLIRGGGSKTLAAEKINNSRVGRGGAGCLVPGTGGCGLTPLTGAETDEVMLAALQYEQEIEFMGQGPTPFFNRRRVEGLFTDTPRHMPVPAKELDVLQREIYTFGGPNRPALSIAGQSGGATGTTHVRSVRDIWNEYRALKHFYANRRY